MRHTKLFVKKVRGLGGGERNVRSSRAIFRFGIPSPVIPSRIRFLRKQKANASHEVICKKGEGFGGRRNKLFSKSLFSAPQILLSFFFYKNLTVKSLPGMERVCLA